MDKLSNIKNEKLDKSAEEIYCNQEVGTCLYSDNLLCIERTELIGDIFRLFAKNVNTDSKFINTLEEYKKKGAFFNLLKIDDLCYDKSFIDFLFNARTFQNIFNNFIIREGLLDKGYLDKTFNTYYSKDLRPSIEMTLIMKDFTIPVICRQNKIYRALNVSSSKFINSVKLKQNNLIIGLDTGYLLFKNKNVSCNVYVYEPDEEYVEFFKKNILSKFDTSLNIFFLKSLEPEDIKDLKIDNIILDNSCDIDITLKYFMDFKLYDFLNILQIDNINNIYNKLRVDCRDIIMAGGDKFRDVLLENFKDFKGISQSLISAELDFLDKVVNYLDTNNIFYTNYKKVQRDLNNVDFLINILKNY